MSASLAPSGMQSGGNEAVDHAIGLGTVGTLQPIIAFRNSTVSGVIMNNSETETESWAMTPIATGAHHPLPLASPAASSGRTTLDGKQRGSGCCAALGAFLLRVGPSWCSHPDIQKHCKLILVAIFFCIVGTALCAVGLVIFIPEPHLTFCLGFIGGGIVIFIPGIYYVIYVICAYHGCEGYKFDNLPSMD